MTEKTIELVTQSGSVAARLPLLGGSLPLDYVNTAEGRGSEHALEFLHDYGDLVAWSRHVGILDDREVASLLGEAERHPAQATAVLEQAFAVREAIYRLCIAAMQSHAPLESDLAILNRALSDTLARARVIATSGGYAMGWTSGEHTLDRMLWPIVRSAADLLTSEERLHVHACAGCDWLFLDTSRNRSRRWCTMAVCGNRAKRRRHYHRTQALRLAEAH